MIPQTLPKHTIDEDRALLNQAFARVLESGSYILGREVEAFEAAFADYIGVAHGIGVANGTDAVEIALRAVGLRAGDRVATVSHTAVATVAAIRALGADPVFVDIDPATCLMDLHDLARRMAARPVQAVVAVHLYGGMVPPEPLRALCRAHGAALVEDCAQAHGARWRDRRAGSFGDAAAFSFYPTKNLGAIGDGGMVTTDDPDVAETARMLRQYGWTADRVSALEGLNSRLDPIQAAFLGVFLHGLDARNARRRAIAAAYDRALADLPLRTPAVAPDVEPVYHQYVIQTERRDALAATLASHGVRTAIHYPVPVHRQPAYKGFATDLPATDQAVTQILSLPMFPHMTDDDVATVIDRIRAFFSLNK